MVDINPLADTQCSLPCGQNQIRVPEIISLLLP